MLRVNALEKVIVHILRTSDSQYVLEEQSFVGKF